MKRPTYAPIPGLSDKPTPVSEPPPIVPNLPPLPPKNPSPFDTNQQNYQIPLNTSQPQIYNPNSYAPSQNDPLIAQQNQLNLQTPVNFNTQPFNPQQYFNQPASSNLQSPVMAAMPISEVASTNAASNTENYSAPTLQQQNQVYRPAYHHWFFKREIEGKVIWEPFSMMDSLALEQAFTSSMF